MPNLRRGHEVLQVGAEVDDGEHAVNATDAVVERGQSVLHSPPCHWISDGVSEPPEGVAAVALKQYRANY